MSVPEDNNPQFHAAMNKMARTITALNVPVLETFLGQKINDGLFTTVEKSVRANLEANDVTIKSITVSNDSDDPSAMIVETVARTNEEAAEVSGIPLFVSIVQTVRSAVTV